MNFRQFGIGLVTAVTVTVGAVIAEAPAKAATLAPGAFLLAGGTSASDTDTSISNGFTLNFSNMSVLSSLSQGVFAGLNGTPTVNSLFLTDTDVDTPGGDDIFNAVVAAPNTPTFITGLKLADSTAIIVELISGTFEGKVSSLKNYNLGGTFSGRVRDLDGFVLADGTFSASLKPSSFSFSTIGVQTVPTPALLPGLIGMGVAAMRKKRKDEESEVTPESAEARA